MNKEWIKQSLYLISNACVDVYEENSLVKFKNKLPITIQVDRNEGVEVALSYLGISNNFKNISTPPNNLPSFMITNCLVPEVGLVKGRPVQIPVKFKFSEHEDENTLFPCQWFKYYFENKYYSLEEIKKYFQNVSTESNTDIQFTDDMVLEIKTKLLKNFWILIHKSMIDSFNFINIDSQTEGEFIDDPSREIYNVATGDGSFVTLRKSYYEGELYYTYRIKSKSVPKERDYFLSSNQSNILERIYPSVIKVVCENISPQIFNNTYSRDLIVFCPDFEKKEDYSSTEFSSRQYVPISNTTIDHFSIKLVDQNNNPIQLLPGPATLLKMDLRLRKPEKKSFNIRLTSEKNSEFPENNNSIFKVKLPAPIIVNRNWRVALTSISNPNTFSTLIEDEATRSFYFRPFIFGSRSGASISFNIPNNKRIYSLKELVSFINKKLTESRIGSVRLDEEEKVVFKFELDMIVVGSSYLLKILGYSGKINEKGKVTSFYLTSNPAGITPAAKVFNNVHAVSKVENGFEFKFENITDLNYLKPNYYIVYSNMVSRSIVGGIMSNILKVVPIKSSSDEYYVISDFKHKEYYELQNTEISDIEIQLRSHDGELINFASHQDVILNLEFSNYQEITG